MSDDERSDPGGSAGVPGSPSAEPERLGFWRIAASTVAAAFGVQSKANKERDFAAGKPIHFIIAGIVFTAVFVLSVIGIVNLVLA